MSNENPPPCLPSPSSSKFSPSSSKFSQSSQLALGQSVASRAKQEAAQLLPRPQETDNGKPLILQQVASTTESLKVMMSLKKSSWRRTLLQSSASVESPSHCPPSEAGSLQVLPRTFERRLDGSLEHWVHSLQGCHSLSMPASIRGNKYQDLLQCLLNGGFILI